MVLPLALLGLFLNKKLRLLLTLVDHITFLKMLRMVDNADK